ncbi:MAG: hypothetical protein WA133_04245 [Syntrophales bacterium]
MLRLNNCLSRKISFSLQVSIDGGALSYRTTIALITVAVPVTTSPAA